MEIHQLLNSDDDDEGVGASCIAADANNVDPPSAPVTTDPRQPYRNIDDDRVLAASILSGLRYGSRDDASHHHCQSQSFSGYQPKQGHEQRAFPISPDSLRGYPSGPASSSPGTASKAHQLHTSLFGRSLDQAFGTPKVLSAPIKKEQSSRSSTVDIKTPKDNTFAERFRSPQHNETDEATAKAIEAALNEVGDNLALCTSHWLTFFFSSALDAGHVAASPPSLHRRVHSHRRVRLQEPLNSL